MNDTDRELTAVKDRVTTLERRIAVLEKQLAEVANQSSFNHQYVDLNRKFALYGSIFGIGFVLVVLLVTIIMIIVDNI